MMFYINNRIKILICDSSREYRQRLSDYLAGYGFFTVTLNVDVNGTELSECIRSEKPDIVIMECAIHETGAAKIIRDCHRSDHKPYFIINSSYTEPFDGYDMLSGDNCCYMIRPIENESLIEHIHKAVNINAVEEQTRLIKNIREQITEVIHQIGIPAHLKGYYYLREALILVLKNGVLIDNINKQLYPAIAKTFNVSESSVEKAIRNAIEVGLQRGDLEVIDQLFGCTISSKKGKPSNREFIALVADHICEKNYMQLYRYPETICYIHSHKR